MLPDLPDLTPEEEEDLYLQKDWTPRVKPIVEKITGHKAPYKRSLILRAVLYRLLGKPWSRNFTEVELASFYVMHAESPTREIYYECLKVATEATEEITLAYLRRANLLIARNSVKAVTSIIETLETTLDEKVRLQASFGLLDRAGITTAPKASVTVNTNWKDDAKTLGLDPTTLFESVVGQVMLKITGGSENDPGPDGNQL